MIFDVFGRLPVYYYYLDKQIQAYIRRLLLHNDDEQDKYHILTLFQVKKKKESININLKNKF